MITRIWHWKVRVSFFAIYTFQQDTQQDVSAGTTVCTYSIYKEAPEDGPLRSETCRADTWVLINSHNNEVPPPSTSGDKFSNKRDSFELFVVVVIEWWFVCYMLWQGRYDDVRYDDVRWNYAENFRLSDSGLQKITQMSHTDYHLVVDKRLL